MKEVLQLIVSRVLLFVLFFSFLECIQQNNRAVTRDFQQCGILIRVDSDKPVQPPFKLRNSK